MYLCDYVYYTDSTILYCTILYSTIHVPLSTPVVEQRRVAVDRRRSRVGADIGDATPLAATFTTSGILRRAGVLVRVVGEDIPICVCMLMYVNVCGMYQYVC